MKSDLEISHEAKLKNIIEIAEELGLTEDLVELYGKYKAKISLEALNTPIDRKGKYILVSAITPTPLGEGKTVTTIGLSMALNKIGKKAVATVRQPSMGPIFGIKGGAAGGGYAQVVPMEEFNLHLTGDIHAVSIAHNLLAAFIDNHIYHGNQLNIDQFSITWPRVVDISDRALRNIIIGLGKRTDGIPRQSSFDIAVASEVMAILALAKDIFDLRRRCGQIVVAATKDKKPVTAEDLQCAGAMTVVLKDAIKPTLMQTLDNTPCLIHAGPFGNIAHGNSSIIADYIGLKYCDYVVTESGFGADMGAEKFVHIKCRTSGLKPDACVLVCSIRALKMHSGKYRVIAGRPLPPELIEENIVDLVQGLPNLIKQIENVKVYGIPVVVAINRFPTDTDNEIELVKKEARRHGVVDVVVSEVFAKGSEGGIELAEAVVKAAEQSYEFRYLYPLEASIPDKIRTIATKIYGASGVEILPQAKKDIALLEEWGFGNLPVCMAKTHLSLSHDPKLKGRPSNFEVPVREIRLSSGAGFVYALCGDMMTMPGLPSRPGGAKVDIDENGNIVGLF
ncbi:formate--tetrahydrofolate ligase [Candidatus Sumerlaeota bacterium]|nr:formate--tetrahydrofolate ligase [Candidatus Sumerlaeota bacterium]